MTVVHPRYLLVVGCSRRKLTDPGVMPAIDRYDGGSYRVICKAKREGYWPNDLALIILSAKHGLLEPDTLIENYDLEMTRERASELCPVVSRALARHVDETRYREVFVNAGRTYRLAIEGWEELLERRPNVIYASGGVGQKARAMIEWLKQKADRLGPCSSRVLENGTHDPILCDGS